MFFNSQNIKHISFCRIPEIKKTKIRTYLRVSYGRHVIIQFFRVVRDGGWCVYVGVWLGIPPLHQARETHKKHTHTQKPGLNNVPTHSSGTAACWKVTSISLIGSLGSSDDGGDPLGVDVVVRQLLGVRLVPRLWQQEAEPVAHVCGRLSLRERGGVRKEWNKVHWVHTMHLRHHAIKAPLRFILHTNCHFVLIRWLLRHLFPEKFLEYERPLERWNV